MRKRTHPNLIHSFLAAICFCGPVAVAEEAGPPIAQTNIEELKSALIVKNDESSSARKRLEVKRAIRDGGKLLEDNPTAPNRFEILGILFGAQRQLLGMDDSARNREAFLETCRQLAKAPDNYAELRLEAELLLSQTEIARQGGDGEARMAALLPMVARYRGTPADGKMLRIAMVMALELGDTKLVEELQQEMAERFAGDNEMIAFQREKMGGQVLGAPIVGTFKRSDGSVAFFPADGLGQSTALYFWTKDEEGLNDLKQLASDWKEKKDEVAGRFTIVSFNVDELPDAGEKILRDLGVDWQALHLPGGRENPLYTTFAQREPAVITMSPTGYAALIMSGAGGKRSRTGEDRDYARWMQSSLSRQWTVPSYVNQLTSLLVGDFLLLDPEGFDPNLPSEIKALNKQSLPLERTPASVTEETLSAIQACFTAPPVRYRLPIEEIRANYEKAEELCAKAIAAHPDAPDLWIVRNRRIVALLGLSKLTADHTKYQRAIEEAKTALDSGMPDGTEVVARYCLAREALRAPDAVPVEVIGNYLESMGGENAPGPAFAAAALLALDAGDRELHEKYRKIILQNHIENPMMWSFVSFLLDRYHRYWLYQVPFTAGWSYGRRMDYSLALGEPEEVNRTISAEFLTLDGKPFRIPQDTLGKWTAVLFTESWTDDKKSQIPSMVTRYLKPYAESRGMDDFQVVVAVLGDDIAPLRAHLEEKPLDCQILVVPGGIANPVVQHLGIVSENERPNALLLRPDGSIAVFLSGLSMQGKSAANVIQNVVDWHDEQAIIAMLERGDLDKAKELAFTLAPPFDPEAVDEKGRKLREPTFRLAHLSNRARVYMAMEQWDAALKDAEGVVKGHTSTAGGMSLRTNELDQAEALRDSIRQKQEEAKR